MCDVDGLKLVNDTLGHDTGDKLLKLASDIIKDSFEEKHSISRIGGDEFAVVLVDIDESYVIKACDKLKNNIKKYNSKNSHLPLSISIGYAVKNELDVTMEILFKKADNNMYREKLNCINSAKSNIVHALMVMLEERDVVTQEHVNRVQDLSVKVAKAIYLPENKIKDIYLLSKFHDIGKIGIRDDILNKPSSLTAQEYNEIKRHCEIGCRIIHSVSELSNIADLILKHHERWDGMGYPFGLKEEEIPIECRLLAIVDTYDVITNKRPYKKAMSHDAAIAEIKRCAGTQFDPYLVGKFIEVLEAIK